MAKSNNEEEIIPEAMDDLNALLDSGYYDNALKQFKKD